MHICYFVYSASEKAQVTFEKRERSGQNDVVPLRWRDPGPGYHVQHPDGGGGTCLDFGEM